MYLRLRKNIYTKRLFVKRSVLLINLLRKCFILNIKILMEASFRRIFTLSMTRFQSYWLSYKEHRVDA